MPEGMKGVLDREDLRRTVADVLDLEIADVTDDARFVEDLEVDSLMALEVMVVLERKYGLKLGESEISRVATLDGAYGLLSEKLPVVS